MSATIYKFPQTPQFKGYKIPLYTQEEVSITLLAVNCFGEVFEKVTVDNLEDYDPMVVIKALIQAKDSNLISHKAKVDINNILKSIQIL